MGHEQQQVFLLLAPAAGIPVAQFHKIDRAVLHRVVRTCEDLSLVHVDLHECSRPDQRVESEIGNASSPSSAPPSSRVFPSSFRCSTTIQK